MLLKLSYTAATVGWLLTRQQAEAFSVVGTQKLSKTTAAAAPGRTPSLSSVPSTTRTFEAAASRRPSRSLPPLCMSSEGNAVESSAGTSSQERSVLDALIDQFTSPKSGNVTATVEEYLDLCDHAFLTHLRRRIEAEKADSPAVRVRHPYLLCWCVGLLCFQPRERSRNACAVVQKFARNLGGSKQRESPLRNSEHSSRRRVLSSRRLVDFALHTTPLLPYAIPASVCKTESYEHVQLQFLKFPVFYLGARQPR